MGRRGAVAGVGWWPQMRMPEDAVVGWWARMRIWAISATRLPRCRLQAASSRAHRARCIRDPPTGPCCGPIGPFGAARVHFKARAAEKLSTYCP